MPLYETVLIARSEITQAQADAVADAVTAQLETDGGAVKKREYWGLRSLAYRIKKNRKGHYILLGLNAASPSVQEMERQLTLNEDVLRFMTVRVEELESELEIGEDRFDTSENAAREASERVTMTAELILIEWMNEIGAVMRVTLVVVEVVTMFGGEQIAAQIGINVILHLLLLNVR